VKQMTHQEQQGLPAARQLVRECRKLGAVQAPATVLPTVMGRLGLVDTYFQVNTPLGTVFVAYNRSGVCAVRPATSALQFEAAFHAAFGRQIHAASEPPAQLVRAITHQLAGTTSPDLRFDLRQLSEFERAVLRKALEIPRGEVRPYAWIAREIGHPGAMRAVGTALARNPVPLLIPCHRVVKSDGHLGRYSMGGADAKRTILQAEGVDPDALEELARAGVRYYGCTSTHVYCFPTCRHAPNTHRIHFASAEEAFRAGYRACRACRPAQAS
jgi:O-6-methylguanine DNA methyltransferase